MLKKLQLSFILILSTIAITQAQQFRTLALLPSGLDENSGILVSSENGVWFHNDSGDSAKLYKTDTLGALLRTITITNATNVDWEDITTDFQGNVYIGDIGNNDNNRQNLKIYKIAHPDSISGTTTTAEVIDFVYGDQTLFPPADADRNYDAEALIWHQDSLYIFTKNRTVPYDGFTYVYQMPADTGTHVATRIDSFDTGEFSFLLSITAASISEDGQNLALLNGAKVWLFSGFTGNDFFANTPQVFNLDNGLTQKEAIDFVDNTTLYISDEQSSLGDAQLYIFDLAPYLDINIIAPEAAPLLVYPNPSNGVFNIETKTNATYSIYNALGQVVYQTTNIPSDRLEIDGSDWQSGIYYIEEAYQDSKAISILTIR